MENDQPRAEDFKDSQRPSRQARYRAKVGSGAKFGFYLHLAFYIGVNLLLLFINLLTTPLLWWALWPIMGWGFALLIHALVSFLLPNMFGARRRLYEQELARQKSK